MSVLTEKDKKKWTNALLVSCCFILAIASIKLLNQFGEWFELEAKFSQFVLVAQLVGVLIGVVVFLVLVRNKAAMNYLDEVYGELLKVVWPDRSSATRLTVGIIIGVLITSIILSLVDLVVKWGLNLLYK